MSEARPTVLVVEDEPEIRQFLRTSLAAEGYRVATASDGEHGDVLRQSATTGLGAVPSTVSVAEGGDVELHVELTSLAPASNETACKVKIFVMRLPQHDLLGIADGGARATGRGQTDSCLSMIGAAIVRDKVSVLLQRQLDAKR